VLTGAFHHARMKLPRKHVIPAEDYPFFYRASVLHGSSMVTNTRGLRSDDDGPKEPWKSSVSHWGLYTYHIFD